MVKYHGGETSINGHKVELEDGNWQTAVIDPSAQEETLFALKVKNIFHITTTALTLEYLVEKDWRRC